MGVIGLMLPAAFVFEGILKVEPSPSSIACGRLMCKHSFGTL